MSPRVYVALVHYPVRNREGKLVTTSITNYDLHDIARTCRTFGIIKYYLVNPLESQLMLAERIAFYWQHGLGSRLIPDRKEAFTLVRVKETIEQVIAEIQDEEGSNPVLVGTDAREMPNTISYSALRGAMNESSRPYLLIFGTGWGIEQTWLNSLDYRLEPIRGTVDAYNHLSVRAAVAIILDRLLGERKLEK
ncbi:MAG: RNA methyltransferase [bacterium]|nr:RNA methyltransferase [bacterium]